MGVKFSNTWAYWEGCLIETIKEYNVTPWGCKGHGRIAEFWGWELKIERLQRIEIQWVTDIVTYKMAFAKVSTQIPQIKVTRQTVIYLTER